MWNLIKKYAEEYIPYAEEVFNWWDSTEDTRKVVGKIAQETGFMGIYPDKEGKARKDSFKMPTVNKVKAQESRSLYGNYSASQNVGFTPRVQEAFSKIQRSPIPAISATVAAVRPRSSRGMTINLPKASSSIDVKGGTSVS